MGTRFTILLTLLLLCGGMFVHGQDKATIAQLEKDFEAGQEVFNEGRFAEAITIFAKMDVRLKSCREKLPIEYVYCPFIIGGCHFALHNYKEALVYIKTSVERSHEMKLPEDEDYADIIVTLSNVYSLLSDHERTLYWLDKAAAIYKTRKGAADEDYLSALSGKAQVYKDLGDYKKAFGIHTEIAETWSRAKGRDNLFYADCLQQIGRDYYYMGDYPKAMDYYNRALALSTKLRGADHEETASILCNIGQVHGKLGNYAQAKQYIAQTLAAYKKKFGAGSLQYAIMLSNMAELTGEMGDYPGAIEQFLQSAAITKAVAGDQNDQYSSDLNNLGIMYTALDNHTESLKYFTAAADIQLKTSGRDTPEYGTMMSNIASVYNSLKNYPKAIEYASLGVEIKGKTVGTSHPSYAQSLNTLGIACHNQKDYPAALKHYSQAIEIYKKLYLAGNPEYAVALKNMGSAYQNMDDYPKGVEYFNKALEMFGKFYAQDHPLYLGCMEDIGYLKCLMGQHTQAMGYFVRTTQAKMGNIRNNFNRMTEQERSAAWEEQSYAADLMFYANNRASTPATDQLCYNTALFTKGLLLNSSVEFGKIIQQSGNKEAITEYDRLKELRARIDILKQKQGAQALVDSLDALAAQRERRLISLSKEYGSLTRNLSIDWKAVQAKLADDDVAVEFVRFIDFEEKDYADAALVLRKGWAAPRMVFLFYEGPFGKKRCGNGTVYDALTYSSIERINLVYSDPVFYQNIWQPIEKYLKRGDRIFFAADGAFHHIGIEYLSIDGNEKISDRYRPVRLSSTKVLAMDDTGGAKSNAAVLYGGLDYNSDADMMLAFASGYGTRGTARPKFDADAATTRGMAWSYLPGTREEVAAIDGILNRRQYKTTLFSGENGVEESFKALSGKGVRFLHIATHGFYISQNEQPDARNPVLHGQGSQADPLLRSGLVFAGANNAWLNKALPAGVDDGILTAREIAGLDLRGMELVVLSACQTGLGDIASDGVYGLQRAFKIAGAKTLVVSLWEVSDQATQVMMTEFYKALAAGKTKRDAFNAAQKTLMGRTFASGVGQADGSDPYFWASFILLD